VAGERRGRHTFRPSIIRCRAEEPVIVPSPAGPRRAGLACALALVAFAGAAPLPAAIQVAIEGIEGELAAAARANLEMQRYAEREVSSRQMRRLYERAPAQIRRALEPYGYYSAEVESALAGSAEAGYRATFRVRAGERVTVRNLRVVVDGPAGAQAEIAAALGKFEPALGKPLEHGVYEASKARIASELQTSGYFDAKLTAHRVEVTRATRSADVNLAWDSGLRYRLGALRISKTQFPEEFLQRYVPWQEGDPYEIDRLFTLQQRLVDADYFSSVFVEPVIDDRADGQVPVSVTLVPAKRMIYTGNLYLSTDHGPGGSVGAQRRWLNAAGHKGGILLELSRRLQGASMSYRIPRPGLQNGSLNFAAGWRDEQTDTSREKLARLSAAQVREGWKGYRRTLGLQYLNGNFEIADELSDSEILFAEALLERKRADDAVFPRRGLWVAYALRLSPGGVLSDTSFAELRADAKWVRPLDARSRLLLRASLGTMVVDDFDALPPELRFFAGGDRSIRGFDYEQIGDVNEAGGVIGGRHLGVASIEYERFLYGNWGAAVFVDAGDAFSDAPELNIGAGIGIRWKSPVGLVRVDIATPVNTEFDESLRLHVMIGPDL
jgi:translocation and assembly module TamA